MRYTPSECLRCRGPVDRGFIFDFMGEHGNTVAQWAAGTPTKSFWSGVKADSEALLPVAAFRCASCGYLELYARPEFDAR
ncbi:MAG TPA: hypothetical protein VGF45_06945 [Polyangia bacterium]